MVYHVLFTFYLLAAVVLQARGLMRMSDRHATLHFQTGDTTAWNQWCFVTRCCRILLAGWIGTTVIYTGIILWLAFS